jgi:hypothetical protein
MPDRTGTKMVAVVAASPMPVLLTNPSPDPRYDDQPTVRVVPGLIRLGSRPYRLKEVVWINESGGDVTFTFDPAGSAQFFDLKENPGPFTVKNDEKLTLKIAENPPENRIYSYRVDCKRTPNLQAQGNSEPEVSCP